MLDYILYYTIIPENCLILSRVCKIWRYIIIAKITKYAKHNRFYKKILSIIEVLYLHEQNEKIMEFLGNNIVTMVTGDGFARIVKYNVGTMITSGGFARIFRRNNDYLFKVKSIITSSKNIVPSDGICYYIYPCNTISSYCLGMILINTCSKVTVFMDHGYILSDSTGKQLNGHMQHDGCINIIINVLKDIGPYRITHYHNDNRISIQCGKVLNHIIDNLHLNRIKSLYRIIDKINKKKNI